MPQNRFDLIVFDCDGVLVDSEPLAELAYHNVYASHGMDLPAGTPTSPEASNDEKAAS